MSSYTNPHIIHDKENHLATLLWKPFFKKDWTVQWSVTTDPINHLVAATNGVVFGTMLYNTWKVSRKVGNICVGVSLVSYCLSIANRTYITMPVNNTTPTTTTTTKRD